jgi:hypothetical protein
VQRGWTQLTEGGTVASVPQLQDFYGTVSAAATDYITVLKSLGVPDDVMADVTALVKAVVVMQDRAVAARRGTNQAALMQAGTDLLAAIRAVGDAQATVANDLGLPNQ